jgi:multicomponent Na+:H+ antiporter subunit D
MFDFGHLLRTAAPALSVGVCLLGVVGIVLTRRSRNVREGVSLLTAGLNFALVAWTYARYRALGATFDVTLLRIGPDLSLAFRVDGLGILFALVASGLWILNTLYSIGYMRAHAAPRQTRFYACFAVAIAAAMGAAFAANLFTLFAFYEVLSLCTYPLVRHAETPEARAGANRYLAYLLGASIAFQLPALFLTYHAAGTLDFAALPSALSAALERGDVSGAFLGATFLLFVAGMAKCAVMPFHAWLPAAMVAPTPVSALLHAVAVVKLGVFGVSRVVFDVFGTDLLGRLGVADVLVVAASVTIVGASLVALVQDNLKRRLAYSTISQLSYVLLGVGLLAPQAGIGGVSHIAVHAVSKITLFFAAGAIYVAHHRTRVSELDGIGRRMPITMTAFAIAAMSMIGLPPAAGLVSKWYLLAGAADQRSYAVLAVLFASALLNAGYFLPIVWRAFFRPPARASENSVREAPWPCVVALAATAVATVLLFFFPESVLRLAEEAVGAGSPR